jgi:hypothetical protein
VILGAPRITVTANARTGAGDVGTPKYVDPVRDNVADEWRSLPMLREWVCDGVCLSNDEPYCHTGNGTNDSQLFNVAIQGVCALNNGYCAQTPRSNRTLTNACSGTAHAWPGSARRAL